MISEVDPVAIWFVKTQPTLLRMILGLYKSVFGLAMITASTFAASAVLKMAPIFPGFSGASATRIKGYFDLNEMLNLDGTVPYCDKCGGIVKPDVVLYEEGLDNDIISKTVAAISSSDLLIIGGTSLVVYPAASFINYFKGSNIVLINKSKTPYDSKADLVINESIGKVLDEVIKFL